MNHNHISVFVSTLLCLVVATSTESVLADHHGGDWEVLFDGSSTDSFRGFKRDGFPEKGWKIEDGALRTIVGGDEVDIVSKKQYDNFELVFEWKVTPGANSGVIYRVSEEFQASPHTGPEYQILDDAKHKDGKSEVTSAGALYALVAPANKTLKPVGEYNQSRIVLVGNLVEHWLNGEKVVAADLASDGVRALIAKSKFKDRPRFAKMSKGHICFQHHHDEVWYKNIKVRPLTDTTPRPARRLNRLTKAEREAGWMNLFNGKNTNRWRGFMKETFPDQGWVIEGDSLKHIAKAGGGDIITKRRFEEFDFRFDWKVAPQANSGVKYFIMEERKATIGHEYQVIDLGPERHTEESEHGTASFYVVLPPANLVMKPVGEFNRSRIWVQGQWAEHWLNGIMVLRYRLGSPEVLAAVQDSKFKEVDRFGFRHRGHLLLQDHGDEVYYQNLKVRDLSGRGQRSEVRGQRSERNTAEP